MNTRKNNGLFRHISLLVLIVYSISIIAFAPPKASAQSNVTRKTRLTIPVNKLAVLVSEKNNNVNSNKILVADYLSSTKAVVNEEGVNTSIPSYYPYGSIRDDVQDETDRLYTQQKKVTADSSIYNYNARYYNPTTGLFIQPDSVKGPHRYSYADDDPIMLNDPSGNCPMCVGALLGGGLDLGIQLFIEGKTMEEVNWGSVAISAAGGSVGAGLGANIAKMAATTGAKAIMMVGADAAVGLGTSIIEGRRAGLEQNFGEALVASMFGATFGAAGGKVASKVGNTITKPVINQFDEFMRARGPLSQILYRNNVPLADGANLILDTSYPNAYGWANGSNIAINPAMTQRTATFAHEVGHHRWHFSDRALPATSPYRPLQYAVNELEAEKFAQDQLVAAMRSNWHILSDQQKARYQGELTFSHEYLVGYRKQAQSLYEDLINQGHSNDQIWNSVASRQGGVLDLKRLEDRGGGIYHGRQ